ncbi:hydroxymethylpyrimidine/phosphomethylpyrimidine kinase [Mesorhizobium sp. 1B3]|uniref:hydroxymethylpyrimidine/phosphomethylpyrimidine kinase n=1 Tax=Mesorhizobium sp. 1B3 TaxID=3243599 RepID=UPI003D968D7E
MAMTLHVLIVAGTDSSGGAGLSRDVETVAAFGLRSAVAVTAVTVQTHGTVRHVELVAPSLVADQMRAALEANRTAAIKIGMLSSVETIDAVSSVIAEHPGIPVVLDPVLASSSGRALLPPEAVGVLQKRLMPLCRLVTPNLPELAMLTGSLPARNESEILRQGAVLFDPGPGALLIKGGHAAGEHSTDFLLEKGQPVHRFGAPRLPAEMRGTGCMLASAIAAGLASGAALETSVSKAKQFVFDKLSVAAETSSPR